jgi:hypothetical protein
MGNQELFIQWYVEPLRVLENTPGGHGAFIALATACFLYERYASAVLGERGVKATREAKVAQLGHDFNVDHATAQAFWDVIRDGLLHQGMPLQRKNGASMPKWAFSGPYAPLLLQYIDATAWLKVQPWSFTKRVLDLWEANLSLLARSGSFPWAGIGPVPA